MGDGADAIAAHGADDSAAPAAMARPEPADRAALRAVSRRGVSLLAELAKDPANGLKEIGPGLYWIRKDSPAPDR
jgi:hypothetical protein